MEGRDREIKQVRRECVGRGWGGESVCGLGLRKVNSCALELERACGERLGLSRKVHERVARSELAGACGCVGYAR